MKIFDTVVSSVKPMHAINNAPMIDARDTFFHYLSNAGIPYSRLHDTGGAYGNNRYVDIGNIFRNFDADENDPASYDFAFTDWLTQSLKDYGTEPFYRLGTSIENQHYIKAYRIFPPEDNLKWAKICEHIIAHYNEGWADGYKMGIKYWEIWNEPDNTPDIADNPMWKGTFEQYINLYKTTAKHLKTRFGDSIKVGGYASCGFYALLDTFNKEANSSARTEYFVECFHRFLKSTSEDNTPLDFFSWHSYSDLPANLLYTKYVREQLDSYGFVDTENILNEWNPGISLRGTLQDSANIASNMLALQHTSMDMLMYYDGQIHGNYQGLYNPVVYEPFKSYYVFVAFNELYKLKNSLKIDITEENIYAAAARDNDKIAIMLTNTGSDREISIEISDERNIYTVYRLNNEKNLEQCETLSSLDNLKISQFETVLIK